MIRYPFMRPQLSSIHLICSSSNINLFLYFGLLLSVPSHRPNSALCPLLFQGVYCYFIEGPSLFSVECAGPNLRGCG